MNIWPFGAGKKPVLGIDIGTSAIRLVELSTHGGQEKLENYARFSLPVRRPRYFGEAKKGELVFSTKQLGQMVRRLLREAKTEGKKASFSIPDFSTLFTTFPLPAVKRDEASEAVRFEARQRVPLPVSEVTLDWLKIGGEYAPRSKEGIEVLLVVVPNRVIDKYTRISEFCGLDLYGVEAEVFGLQRALVREGKGVVGVVDIGAQSTTASVIDNGVLKISHSFDLAGNNLTARVKERLGLSYKKAEVVKENKGLLDEEIKRVLTPLLNEMAGEIEKTADRFYNRKGKEVRKWILAGASAALPGLKKHWAEKLGQEVEIARPFQGLAYPAILEREVKKISPGFAIATGMAIKSLGR